MIKSNWKAILGMLFLAALFMACQRKNEALKYSDYAHKMARSVMERNPDGYGDWDYVTGTVLKGFEKLWKRSGDQVYYDYLLKTVDSVIMESGQIVDYEMELYNIDMINEGRILLFLYRQTGLEKYKKAADLLRKQIENQPRTDEGGFWHKKRYPYQMWLDGLYMASPFYLEYGLMFDEPGNLEDVVNQFVYMENHARDDVTGLLYHGWDEKKVQEWANPETGLSQCFWGRGMGWYAMALVDVLDYMEENRAHKDRLAGILRRLFKAVIKVQDRQTGVWWQVVNQPDRAGNYLEASASCMFVYALAKGVRKGYVNEAIVPILEQAYQGILENFVIEHENGTLSLTEICKSAGLGYGRDGSFQYYAYEEPRVHNDGKGIGPFILASLEMDLLMH